MAGVTRFEDLVAWQKARVITREVYALTRTDAFRSDLALTTQSRRCAISVMANIAEGFARGGATEFQRYLDIAFGSCSELTSHLYVALDVGYASETEFTKLRTALDEVGRLILALKHSSVTARRTPHSALRTAPKAPPA